MTDAKLSDFIATVLRAKRIRFGDVRRLARDVLPAGSETRRAIEALLRLDRAVDRTDPTWTDFVVGTIRQTLVAARSPGMPPWLKDAIGSRPTRTGRAIEREVAIAGEIGSPRRGPGDATLAFVDGPYLGTPEIAGLRGRVDDASLDAREEATS